MLNHLKIYLQKRIREDSKKKQWSNFRARFSNWISKYGFKKEPLLTKLTDTLERGECIYCKQSLHLGNISLDHRKSIRTGGGVNEVDNVDFICKTCNKRKDVLSGDNYKKLLDLISTFTEIEQKYILKQLSKSTIQFYKK